MFPGSLKGVVFRYSNQEADVVELHRRVIDDEGPGYVWWGWWKKDHEPGRDQALDDLQQLVERQGRLRVALLNRKDEHYFQATVDKVHFLGGGKRGSAPDDRCPRSLYEPEDPGCPAWLRVRRIDSLTKQEYLDQYPEVPAGDSTFYELREAKGKKALYPLPNWEFEISDAPGDCILHLSDVHFGSMHGYAQKTTVDGRSVASPPTLLSRILEAVSVTRSRIGVIVLSGDLISRGESEGYPAVVGFLNDLLGHLRLEKEHVVIVPGNHDFATLEAIDEKPTMKYGHEQAYRDFISVFFGWDRGELERLHLFKLNNGEHVAFSALNSSRLRGQEVREYGYVGRHRYSAMMDHLEESLERRKISAHRFAVLHHHLLPVHELEVPRNGTPISLTVDAAEIFGELQERGFDAVLHGHQHRPFFFQGGRAVFQNPVELSAPGRQVCVIGNGSSGAAPHTLGSDFPFNTLGIYQISSHAMGVRWLYFGPKTRPGELARWEVPWNEQG